MTTSEVRPAPAGPGPGGVEQAGADEPGVEPGTELGADSPGAEQSTRDRILDVALELFTEQGFDKTSLRQIADRLGFSKAALYYHFASKGDILVALHMRLHDVGFRALAAVETGQVGPADWQALLDELIDEMMNHRTLFLLHERNRAAIEQLHTEGHEGDHEDLEAQFRLLLSDQSVAVRQRIRLAAGLGAIIGGLLLPGDVFAGTPAEVLREELHAIVHEVLSGGSPAA